MVGLEKLFYKTVNKVEMPLHSLHKKHSLKKTKYCLTFFCPFFRSMFLSRSINLIPTNSGQPFFSKFFAPLFLFRCGLKVSRLESVVFLL